MDEAVTAPRRILTAITHIAIIMTSVSQSLGNRDLINRARQGSALYYPALVPRL